MLSLKTAFQLKILFKKSFLKFTKHTLPVFQKYVIVFNNNIEWDLTTKYLDG